MIILEMLESMVCLAIVVAFCSCLSADGFIVKKKRNK
jgi:hypothetical protein